MDNQVENSCARVDAILIRRKDSKSHVKVHRVYNPHGPQTNFSSSNETNQQNTSLNSALDERLSESERFLGITKPVPRDIYERVKKIEDKLLYLESISPEYKNICVSILVISYYSTKFYMTCNYFRFILDTTRCGRR